MTRHLIRLSRACAASAFLTIAASSLAQTPSQVILVWSGTPPGSVETAQKEVSLELNDTRFTPPNPDTLVWNVTQPSLAVFKPAAGKSNGAAVIVAPGGGFRVLSYKNEGLRVAHWLAEHGVTAFVLKYRLHRMPDDPAEVKKGLDTDARRSVASVRQDTRRCNCSAADAAP